MEKAEQVKAKKQARTKHKPTMRNQGLSELIEKCKKIEKEFQLEEEQVDLHYKHLAREMQEMREPTMQSRKLSEIIKKDKKSDQQQASVRLNQANLTLKRKSLLISSDDSSIDDNLADESPKTVLGDFRDIRHPVSPLLAAKSGSTKQVWTDRVGQQGKLKHVNSFSDFSSPSEEDKLQPIDLFSYPSPGRLEYIKPSIESASSSEYSRSNSPVIDDSQPSSTSLHSVFPNVLPTSTSAENCQPSSKSLHSVFPNVLPTSTSAENCQTSSKSLHSVFPNILPTSTSAENSGRRDSLDRVQPNTVTSQNTIEHHNFQTAIETVVQVLPYLTSGTRGNGVTLLTPTTFSALNTSNLGSQPASPSDVLTPTSSAISETENLAPAPHSLDIPTQLANNVIAAENQVSRWSKPKFIFADRI